VTVTVGFAAGGLNDVADMNTLYKEADDALYAAKNKLVYESSDDRQQIDDGGTSGSVKARV
jgi:hypothetical protein